MKKFNQPEFDRQTQELEVTALEHTRQGILFLREMFEKTERDIPKFRISYDGEGGIDVQFRTPNKNLLLNLEHSWDYAHIAWAGIFVGLDRARHPDKEIKGQSKLRGIDDLIDWLNEPY